MERAISKGARNPKALAAKIAREDRADLEAEAENRIRNAAAAGAVAACHRCDENGFVGVTTDGRVVPGDALDADTLARCSHGERMEPDPCESCHQLPHRADCPTMEGTRH